MTRNPQTVCINTVVTALRENGNKDYCSICLCDTDISAWGWDAVDIAGIEMAWCRPSLWKGRSRFLSCHEDCDCDFLIRCPILTYKR